MVLGFVFSEMFYVVIGSTKNVWFDFLQSVANARMDNNAHITYE